MERKHGNYDGKRVGAIIALLQEPTLEAAANRLGLDPATLRRWLRDDEQFIKEYRSARREAVSHAVARLCAESGESVKALLEVIRNPKTPAMARVKAIEIHLNAITRFIELDDLAARLETLERKAQAQGGGSGGADEGGWESPQWAA